LIHSFIHSFIQMNHLQFHLSWEIFLKHLPKSKKEKKKKMMNASTIMTGKHFIVLLLISLYCCCITSVFSIDCNSFVPGQPPSPLIPVLTTVTPKLTPQNPTFLWQQIDITPCQGVIDER